MGGLGGPVYGIRVHGWILTESGGSNSSIYDLWTPNPQLGGAAPTAPANSTGAHIAKITVAANGVQTFPSMDEGVYFENGLWVQASGTGTGLGILLIS